MLGATGMLLCVAEQQSTHKRLTVSRHAPRRNDVVSRDGFPFPGGSDSHGRLLEVSRSDVSQARSDFRLASVVRERFGVADRCWPPPSPRVSRCWYASWSGYTSGMKTAVSIPDDLFRRADELANQLGKSRSELYREALADYVERRDPQAVTEALNAIADELAADRVGFVEEAARRTLKTGEW